MRLNLFNVTLLPIIAAALVACNSSVPQVEQRSWVEESGSTMGSTYRWQFSDPFDLKSKQKLSQLIKDQRSFLIEIENLISTWKTDSQLSQFNRQTTTDWFPVDVRTVEIVELAAELSAIDRRFDVTVAPLSDLWGFGPAGRQPRPPNAMDINDVLQHIGSDKLQFRREPPALRKTDPRVQIDLSALAAGYVADKIAQQLISQGVTDFYIDVAGEIVTGGRNRRGQKWRVGIAEPIVGSNRIYTKLDVTNCAIATSGNYRKHIEVDGKSLGHILDPTTGRPAEADVLSATVIHSSCARADAIATLLMTMPAKDAMKLAHQQAWKVLLLVKNADGSIGEMRAL